MCFRELCCMQSLLCLSSFLDARSTPTIILHLQWSHSGIATQDTKGPINPTSLDILQMFSCVFYCVGNHISFPTPKRIEVIPPRGFIEQHILVTKLKLISSFQFQKHACLALKSCQNMIPGPTLPVFFCHPSHPSTYFQSSLPPHL